MRLRQTGRYVLFLIFSTGLMSCGGGGGGSDDETSELAEIEAVELVDPSPRAGDFFGEALYIEDTTSSENKYLYQDN